MSFPIIFPDADVGSSAPSPLSNHAELARDRLIEQYKAQPNFAALLDALNEQTQELENALYALLTQRGVTTAVGAQLDVLGEIVSQPRNGLSDDSYRLWLLAKIRLNKGSSTPEEIYDIFTLIVPAGCTVKIRDEFSAAFTLEVNGGAVLPDNLLPILRLARAAGVRAILEWREADPSLVFTFDGTSAQALDNGVFAGAAV